MQFLPFPSITYGQLFAAFVSWYSGFILNFSQCANLSECIKSSWKPPTYYNTKQEFVCRNLLSLEPIDTKMVHSNLCSICWDPLFLLILFFSAKLKQLQREIQPDHGCELEDLLYVVLRLMESDLNKSDWKIITHSWKLFLCFEVQPSIDAVANC